MTPEATAIRLSAAAPAAHRLALRVLPALLLLTGAKRCGACASA
ncbi:MAG TPA: hypothetical protein VEU54_03385 [Steroidobacteraceae bacterium]|nr:hypothetical protein [Steroidobacteraceae bacterium]